MSPITTRNQCPHESCPTHAVLSRSPLLLQHTLAATTAPTFRASSRNHRWLRVLDALVVSKLRALVDIQVDFAVVLTLSLDDITHQELGHLLQMRNTLLHALGLIRLVEALSNLGPGGVQKSNITLISTGINKSALKRKITHKSPYRTHLGTQPAWP